MTNAALERYRKSPSFQGDRAFSEHALAAILARPIAHRGLHGPRYGWIENSCGAAEAAIEAGFGIECDVQFSGDGEAVVFHDETLDRLTDETGPLGTRTAAALAMMPLQNGGGDTIPLLPALLTRVAGRVPVVIEIKSRFDGDMRLASRVAAVIADYRGPLALKSFDLAVVAYCRALGLACPLGLVGPTDAGHAEPDGSDPLAYDFLSWNIDDLAGRIAILPQVPTMSWTIRSPEAHARATDLGAQIVFEHYEPNPP